MDRILVVFYSYTGTCRKLARLLCAQMDWALGEVMEQRPRAGPTGSLRCLVDSLLRRTPPIRYDGPDPAQFDAVVLVSPVWVGRLASPMRSFVAAHGAQVRQVAVLSGTAGGDAAGAVAEIERRLGREPLVVAASTAREVDDDRCAPRLRAFGQSLRQTGRATEARIGGPWSPRAA